MRESPNLNNDKSQRSDSLYLVQKLTNANIRHVIFPHLIIHLISNK